MLQGNGEDFFKEFLKFCNPELRLTLDDNSVAFARMLHHTEQKLTLHSLVTLPALLLVVAQHLYLMLLPHYIRA